MDLRCDYKKHAVLIEPGAGGIVEVKCDSRFCGASRDQIVLHRFSAETGALIKTEKFANPNKKVS